METQSAPLNAAPGFASRLPALGGVALLALALGAVAAFLWAPLLGLAITGAVAALGALALANQRPFFLIAALFLAAVFNIGRQVGPATLKVSEGVTGAMLALIAWRVFTLNRPVLRRLRRLAFPISVLAVLGGMAVLTAWGREHFFNVRYEIQNYIAFVFAALFFRRRHWPGLARVALFALGAAAIAALTLRFALHISSISLFSEQDTISTAGIGLKDVDMYGGGRFRLAGTFGHKNIFAAFLVLLIPVIAMEALRRFRPHWALALLPALAALALSDSMTGWGAILIILVAMLLLLRRFDYLALATLLMLPVGGLALYRFGDSIFFRVNQLLNTSAGWTTVSARGEIYEIAIRLIKAHPWLGIGRNNFLAEGNTYYPHAHNLYLMKMIEMGVPAGLIFCAFMWGSLALGGAALLRQAPRLAAQGQYYNMLALWLGCCGVFAMNFFDYSYSSFALGPLLMLCLGIVVASAMDLQACEQAPADGA